MWKIVSRDKYLVLYCRWKIWKFSFTKLQGSKSIVYASKRIRRRNTAKGITRPVNDSQFARREKVLRSKGEVGKIWYKIFTIVHNVADKSLMRGVTRYVFPSQHLPLQVTVQVSRLSMLEHYRSGSRFLLFLLQLPATIVLDTNFKKLYRASRLPRHVLLSQIRRSLTSPSRVNIKEDS